MKLTLSEYYLTPISFIFEPFAHLTVLLILAQFGQKMVNSHRSDLNFIKLLLLTGSSMVLIRFISERLSGSLEFYWPMDALLLILVPYVFIQTLQSVRPRVIQLLILGSIGFFLCYRVFMKIQFSQDLSRAVVISFFTAVFLTAILSLSIIFFVIRDTYHGVRSKEIPLNIDAEVFKTMRNYCWSGILLWVIIQVGGVLKLVNFYYDY